MSLGKQLILLICVPFFIMALGLSLYSYRYTASIGIEGVKTGIELCADYMAATADDHFQQIYRVGDSLANHMTNYPPQSETDIYAALEYAYQSNNAIYGGSIIYDAYAFSKDHRLFAPYVMQNADGGFRRAYINYDYTDVNDKRNTWFLNPKQTGKSNWTLPYDDEGAGNTWLCTYSKPFLRDGKFAGVIGIDVSLEWMQAFLEKRPEAIRDHTFCFIVDSDGAYVVDADIAKIRKRENLFEAKNLPANARDRKAWNTLKTSLAKGEKGLLQTSSPILGNGARIWISHTPIPSAGWNMILVADEDAITSDIFRRIALQNIPIALGLAICLAAAVIIVRRLTRSLSDATAFAQSIRDGNFQRSMAIPRQSECGKLVVALNAMAATLAQREREATENLANMEIILDNVTTAATRLNDASNHVSASSRELSAGANDQNRLLTRAMDAASHVRKQAEQEIEYILQAQSFSEAAAASALLGNQDMGEMNLAIRDVAASSARVNDILKAINDIAFQTNLLALNASIEAARAGRHGKGFGVVAEEVRRLAHRSAESATATARILEEVGATARRSMEMSDKTSQTLARIAEELGKVTDLMQNATRMTNANFSVWAGAVEDLENVQRIASANAERAADNARTSADLQKTATALWATLRTIPQDAAPPAANANPNLPAVATRSDTGCGPKM